MKTFRTLLPALACLVAAALATVAHAASTDIAQVPLVTSAPNAVQPNLMFILDDSGSMSSDYLPDWANDNRCRDSGATPVNSGTFGRNCTNEPPFRSRDFNGAYYNPAITYLPPLRSDATSWPSQTSANTTGWTNVKNDAYNVQDTGSTDLVGSYPDVAWCNVLDSTDCLRNGNYVLPGTVGGKSYTVRSTPSASGSGFIAIGAPDAATTEARSFGPHYYLINTAEYCDAPNLRNCQSTATAVFKYPAPLRWCSSDADARAATPTAGSCQAPADEHLHRGALPDQVLHGRNGRHARRGRGGGLGLLHGQQHRLQHLADRRHRQRREPAVCNDGGHEQSQHPWQFDPRPHQCRRQRIHRQHEQRWPHGSHPGPAGGWQHHLHGDVHAHRHLFRADPGRSGLRRLRGAGGRRRRHARRLPRLLHARGHHLDR